MLNKLYLFILDNIGVLAILAVIYFIPSILAYFFNDDAYSIFKINLFWGWTVIGWYIAFALAIGISTYNDIYHPFITRVICGPNKIDE